MSKCVEINKTKLNGVHLIKPSFIFEDFRGFIVELYNKEEYIKNGINVEFLQDNISTSSKNVLRGIHGDTHNYKLVSCLSGKIYTVVVNCDESSKEFGKWDSFTLSHYNKSQIFIPPNFGLAHLVLSDEAIFHYKLSTGIKPDSIKQFTYRYDDPRFNIWWPVKNPILSKRDELSN